MPAGRPQKYETEEDITLQIEMYFKHCDEKPEIANKAGLCLNLGISRDTYNEYKKRFPDAIKGAEAVIENAWVQRLNSTAPPDHADTFIMRMFFELQKPKTMFMPAPTTGLVKPFPGMMA